MSRRPINFDTDRRRVRSRSRGNRLERDNGNENESTSGYGGSGGGDRVGRVPVRSFHAELDDLEAKVKRATTSLNDQHQDQGLERLPPLNANYRGASSAQKSRIPVPIAKEPTKDHPPPFIHPHMDDIINKFTKQTDLVDHHKPAATSKFDELYNKSAILEKHKQFVKPRLTPEPTAQTTRNDHFVTADSTTAERDREFEERRKKIEIEQDLIYEQEEQHFREVVEAESGSGNPGIDINGEKRQYQAALHQEIAALETLEQNPIKLFTLDCEKSYGTIESRESDMYYAESLARTVNDADDANSELATDDFHYEMTPEPVVAVKPEKIRERHHVKHDDSHFPPPPQKVDYFENNKPKKVENSFARSWNNIKPTSQATSKSSEPVYPHPILFAMENKRALQPKLTSTSSSMEQPRESESSESTSNAFRTSQLEHHEPSLPPPESYESKVDDERPISATGNYIIPDTRSTFEYTRQETTNEQQLVTERTPPVQQPLLREDPSPHQPAPTQRVQQQPTQQATVVTQPVIRDYLKPKTNEPSKRVEHLLNKFGENTENAYLSRASDRRSSTSSTTSSGFQARIAAISSEKPKIKLQPTQYGRTQYASKTSGDFTYSHASIRRNEKTPVSSLINRFNPSSFNNGPSKGEDWMPATLKRVKRPSVKSQIAGLEKLQEHPRDHQQQQQQQQQNTSSHKSQYQMRNFSKERHYFEH